MENAVILAGGKGLRFGTDPDAGPKPMAIVSGKPILHRILTLVSSLGFRKAYVVVGYKKDVLIGHFRDGGKYGIELEYIDNANVAGSAASQRKSGLSDAVLLLKDIIRAPFMTILGDEIYHNTDHLGMVRAFAADPAAECFIAVRRTSQPGKIKKNYAVRVAADMLVRDLEEKPERPWNDLIGLGTYLFKPSIFGYIENTAVSPKTGRKELADSMKMMIEDGKRVKAYDVGGEYININYPEDIIAAEKIIGGRNGNPG